MWLLLIGLLLKCNNTKPICFANKDFFGFKLIMLVVYGVSLETFERKLQVVYLSPCINKTFAFLNPYAQKIFTCLDQHLHKTFTCWDQHVHHIFANLNSHANISFTFLYQHVHKTFTHFLLVVFLHSTTPLMRINYLNSHFRGQIVCY